MNQDIRKPIIGFTCGDLNGIGIELIIKSLSDSRLLEFMVPVIFANHKAINFYSKGIPNFQMSFTTAPDLDKLNPKQVNLIQCWQEEASIQPGELTEIGGKYALISLEKAVDALKNKKIDVFLTCLVLFSSIIQRTLFKFGTAKLKTFFITLQIFLAFLFVNITLCQNPFSNCKRTFVFQKRMQR